MHAGSARPTHAGGGSQMHAVVKPRPGARMQRWVYGVFDGCLQFVKWLVL